MGESNNESGIVIPVRGAIWNLLKACWKHQDHLWPAAKAATIYRSKELRVSLASLLRIEKGGKFLLVRSRHRREAYGPYGGVFKYYRTADCDLDRVEFKTDHVDDIERDLRGYLPARYFPAFLNWFKARYGREEQDCLRREMREELQEIQAPVSVAAAVERLSFTLVRRVHEGPIQHANLREPQFRYFEVYRPALETDAAQVVDTLFGMVETHPSELLVASVDEIKRLRADDGRVIGGHTQYLLSSKWHGVEPPEITS